MSLPINPTTNKELNYFISGSQNIPDCNRKLTPQVLEKIKEIFDANSKEFKCLNTFAIALELVSNAKKIHSFSKTHEKFTNNPNEIIEKYHGGTSSILIDQIIHELKKIGIEANSIGYKNIGGSTFNFPVPGSQEPDFDFSWPCAEEYVNEITQHLCQVNFTDENGDKKIIIFKKNFLQGDGVYKFNSEQEFISFLNDTISAKAVKINDPHQAVQKLSQIMTTLTLYEPEKNELMRLNLLSGDLLIDELNLKTVNSMPFNLVDLVENPKEPINVLFKEGLKAISKKEAFELILKEINHRFTLPNDFSDNLKTLLRHRKDFIIKTMHSSVKAIFKSWDIYKKADLLRKQNEFLHHQSSDQYKNGVNNYYQGIKKLKIGDDHQAVNFFKDACSHFKEGLEQVNRSKKVPLSILLENFSYS